MNDNLVLIISVSAIFDLTLIAILSWIKSRNRPANFWLGWMFFAASAAILDNVCIFEGKGTILLYHIGVFANLSFGGLIISIVRSFLNPECDKIKFDWKLFIPSYIYFPFIVLCIVQPHWAVDTINYSESNKMTVFGIFYNLVICIYSIGSNVFLLLKKTNYHAAEINKVQLKRINEFLWIMLILQIMAFVPFLFRMDIRYIILYMPIFGQLFFLYVFFKMSNSIQSLFDSKPILVLNNGTTLKYAAMKIDCERAEEIRERIIRFMDVEKPYLKIDFTLTEMAKELKVLPSQLSMIINSKLNCSFPEYVNSLRVRTAIELLDKANKQNLTIEAIAYESGFNNRTSFYKAFKKQTGKLPSEYLKKGVEAKEVV